MPYLRLRSQSHFFQWAWLNGAAVDAIHQGSFAASPLWLIDSSPELLGLMHITALISALCLALGFMTRWAAILSYGCILAYVHRNPAALYGFDQVIGFLTLYLAIGPSGARLSLDEYLTPVRQRVDNSVSANVSLRLIQLHLCILYFFAGVSKLKGATWWNGFALWGAIGNQEYQTIDLTWLAGFPLIINVLTHLSVWWEVSYAALIWNRHTRPVWLWMAVAVHLGIGLCFGMLTFGLAMLVANAAFVEPRTWREIAEQIRRTFGLRLPGLA